MWGATEPVLLLATSYLSFNSRTPCGVRPVMMLLPLLPAWFQFTHPVWGATGRSGRSSALCTSFNSRTPCGVRHNYCINLHRSARVSIHAPRVGCDQEAVDKLDNKLVSIHAPRVGCDEVTRIHFHVFTCFNSRTPCGVRQTIDEEGVFDAWFQFTHPVWGATLSGDRGESTSRFQFTHPVWGATTAQHIRGRAILVSIHAPRVGCDSK